jgi:hypothetical protein
MPRVRELLSRFRPAGAPGAASGAGVPVDRKAGLAEELEPVLAALDATQRECESLRESTVSAASARVTEATTQAGLIVERARADAAAARAATAAQAHQRAADETARLAADAAAEADEVLRSARQRRPQLVAAVVAAVRRELVDPVAEKGPSVEKISPAQAPRTSRLGVPESR